MLRHEVEQLYLLRDDVKGLVNPSTMGWLVRVFDDVERMMASEKHGNIRSTIKEVHVRLISFDKRFCHQFKCDLAIGRLKKFSDMRGKDHELAENYCRANGPITVAERDELIAHIDADLYAHMKSQLDNVNVELNRYLHRDNQPLNNALRTKNPTLARLESQYPFLDQRSNTFLFCIYVFSFTLCSVFLLFLCIQWFSLFFVAIL